VQTLNKIVTIGRTFKGTVMKARFEKVPKRPGVQMTRIISIISVLLACAIAGNLAAAEDQGAQPTAPAAAPETPPAPAVETMPTPEAAPPASDVKLQESPPARYTVKRGDTLWGISSRFLKNPWKWPEVWGMNKDEIKNPHLIYPGDVIILDLSGATPRLRLEGVPDGGLSRWYGYELQVSKLEPRMRSSAFSGAIPTIQPKDIDAFLSRSLVVEPDAIALAPKIVAGLENRVVLSANDTAYAVGLQQSKGNYWNVYRPGRFFQDPDTKEMLGREAVYVGDVEVESFGQVSALRIVHARQEINNGDRLNVSMAPPSLPFVPRAPSKKVRGMVIAGSNDALSEFGPMSMVVLNRGGRDGLEPGQVLGVFRNLGKVSPGLVGGESLPLPLQEYGLVMVYRVFNKVSFALVMNASQPVNLRDIVANP
jgi:hypothetical protein